MLTRTLFNLFLTLGSMTALAKPGQPFPPSYDINGDGQITPEEVQQARTEEFPKIDTDGDGYLSLTEMQTWLDQKQTERFNKLDTGGNGSLSLEEFVAGRSGQGGEVAGRIFNLLDTDKGGTLSVDEFKAFWPIQPEVVRLFAQLDTDDDSRISLDEYLAVPVHPQGGPGQDGG